MKANKAFCRPSWVRKKTLLVFNWISPLFLSLLIEERNVEILFLPDRTREYGELINIGNVPSFVLQSVARIARATEKFGLSETLNKCCCGLSVIWYFHFP